MAPRKLQLLSVLAALLCSMEGAHSSADTKPYLSAEGSNVVLAGDTIGLVTAANGQLDVDQLLARVKALEDEVSPLQPCNLAALRYLVTAEQLLLLSVSSPIRPAVKPCEIALANEGGVGSLL